MLRTILFLSGFMLALSLAAQHNDYLDRIKSFQEAYVKNHDVVTGSDRQYLHFFPPDEQYHVTARFERIFEAPWFKMPTSGSSFQVHRVYGIVYFTLHDTSLALHVYQSQDLLQLKDYSDYLFIPFTDKTSGTDSYENGRYLDFRIGDIVNDSMLVIDFNKAYNPYCAYASGQYSCPIPPRENDLPVAVRSGEMKYGKGH